MFRVGDVVELTEAIPGHDLKRGDRGTIVAVHRDNRTYQVAFTRGDGRMETRDVPYAQLRARVEAGA
jgi:ATP-dependent exoDNAse (exonuclease V) alpha subunit